MDSSHIELKGTIIHSVKVEDTVVTFRFSPARIIKTMTGSKERTLWSQAGELVIEGVESSTGLPTRGTTCLGGDIDENVYTYRDMIPIPLESRGHIHCVLHLEGQTGPAEVTGTAVRLVLEDVPKYVQHIRPGEDS